jgi:hypothetical protein
MAPFATSGFYLNVLIAIAVIYIVLELPMIYAVLAGAAAVTVLGSANIIRYAAETGRPTCVAYSRT